ncbi:aspartokinase [Iodidimonas nitroreducens]|uniref:Aspartokinase n=1 Tax=Iodidimonas nitroreducens TaxID=1236968 RepID=A0A5A7NCG3_9PROT|nr:aspartate kinase [Iodidimonas nitroreducens]GAK34182.1 aspartokinase [alpha proteobacterium Q-1]GER05305.1 aspartokinase [Iodidimonas nitroreducens]
MARLVKKFGGTSVADLDRIRASAAYVKQAVDEGHEVAVVVSAMAGTTNQLVKWCTEASPLHDAREYDTVVSTGEQVTVGLMAIILQGMGVPARSWLGWQMPMITSGVHGAARIEDIDVSELRKRMGEGQVAVIAGFQGIGPDNRITTLGRGGSDTSAVALAAALGADRCDIYTDVDGVYTTDPRIVTRARKLDRVTYEEMLEMASLGAKVLQTRSVAMAMTHAVRVQVLSSFKDTPGTLVVNEDEIVEKELVTGLAYSRADAVVTVYGMPDRPGTVADLFSPLSEADIIVDMIVQSQAPHKDEAEVTFSVPESDLARTQEVLANHRDRIGYQSIEVNSDVVKLSVIGIGMRSHAGVANIMFRTLADRGINIRAISTSEIKVSVLIDSEYTELALRALHTAYGLDAVQQQDDRA